LRKAFLLLSLALALAAAGCGGGSNSAADTTAKPVASADVPTDAVALVGGAKIPKAGYDELLKQAQASYKTDGRAFPKPGTPEYETLKNQAVQYLVQRAEFAQEAKALGIAVTDGEVATKLDDLKKQYFGGDEKKYQDQIKAQGLTEQQVLADVRAQVVSDKLFAAITKDVTVSDADVQKYYDDNKAQFKVPDTRDVRHILVKTKKQADDLYRQLQNGADFATLAKKYSQDPGSKDNGGKYQNVQKGQFVKPFDDYLFSAKTNELSKPIKSSFGWHIIEPLSDVTPAATTPFDKVKDSIRQQLEQDKKNAAMSTWVAGVQKKYASRVTYAIGFAPPPTATTGSGGAASTQGGASTATP
jgi:parvulin-like peptidyl-prolyl isomerase